MKISFLFLCFIILFSAGAFRTSAALLPRLGPVDISGVIDDVRWIPETTVQGKPGMSGSAGRDRAFSPHFRVKLTDFSGVDASTAIAMTRYLDWSAYNNDGRPSKPTFVLLKIDYPDKNYLKKGMKTKSSATPSGAMKAEHVHLSGESNF